MRTPWLRAYSTERSCSTPAPEAAISSISSKETVVELARVGHDPRVGRVDAGDVGVDLADLGAERGGDGDRARVRAAAAERRDVAARCCETPWKPATSTMLSSSSAALMRSARTSRISALVCDSSVTIPACEPVSEIARWPRSLIAIAHSAQEMRSPVESSMSISRGSGVGGDLLGHRDQLVGRLAARRQHGDDAVARFALLDDPPRGALDALGVGDRGAAELHARSGLTCGRGLHSAAPGEGLAERHLVGVLEVRADRQAARQARDRRARARARAAPRRCAARSPRRSSSGWSRARPRARPARSVRAPRRARAARRSSGPRGRCRRSATARRRARGRRRGTRACAPSGSRRSAPRPRRSAPWSRRVSWQMRQRGSSVRLKQTSHSPIFSLTSRIASASAVASSAEARRMWKASRCAVRLPTPGQLRELGDQPLDGRRVGGAHRPRQAQAAEAAERAEVEAAGGAAHLAARPAPGPRAAPR